MINNWFGVHDGLLAAVRIQTVARARERISASELLILFLCGGASACGTGFIRLGLRIPGNAILLAVLPMALGLGFAPRRFAGFVMSAGAFGTATALALAGLCHFGSGSFISLCLAGPMMDLALAGARSGWRLYLGMVAAGISTNLIALTSRSVSKLLGLDLAGMRPFGTWWLQAASTYTLCGAIAGLIGALCCFHLRDRRQRGQEHRQTAGLGDSTTNPGERP